MGQVSGIKIIEVSYESRLVLEWVEQNYDLIANDTSSTGSKVKLYHTPR